MTKLKEDFEASGGVWKEWNYSNLFTLLKGRKKLCKFDLVENSNVPVYSSDTTNNGIVGYTDLESDYQVNKDIPVYVVFGDHTRTMNIVHKDFCVMDNVKVLIPNINSDKVLQYVTSAWQKSIPNMGYSRHWSCAEVATIYLPTFNNEPSYSYMEQYISLLEEEKMLQVDKFLKDSGLNDTALTVEETVALEKFRKGEVKFEERKIGELFDVLTSNKRFDANKVEVLKKGEHPYIVRTALNNGTKGFLNENEEFLNDGNTISFGQDTATMFYQEKPYFTGDKIKILKHKDDIFNEVNALFFLTAMNKAFSNFSWGSSSFNVDVLEAQKTKLPICSNSVNGTIDYSFMQHFISAQEKLVLKGVVEYKDEVLRAHPDYSFDSHDGCSLAAETMSPLE